MDDQKLSFSGIELIWVVLGFLGAALGIGRMPPMSKWQLFTSLLSGVVFAALAPQWAAWLFQRWVQAPIPAFMNNTVAFFFGVGGMFIVPGFITFWQEFGSNPWKLVTRLLDLMDRLRGRVPPPHEPEDDHAGDTK